MNEKIRVKLKFFILPLSILFIIAGIIRDEHITVLKKAIIICLECIGVG